MRVDNRGVRAREGKQARQWDRGTRTHTVPTTSSLEKNKTKQQKKGSSTCLSGRMSRRKWIKAALYLIRACSRGHLWSVSAGNTRSSTHFQSLWNTVIKSKNRTGEAAATASVSSLNHWVWYVIQMCFHRAKRPESCLLQRHIFVFFHLIDFMTGGEADFHLKWSCNSFSLLINYRLFFPINWLGRKLKKPIIISA